MSDRNPRILPVPVPPDEIEVDLRFPTGEWYQADPRDLPMEWMDPATGVWVVNEHRLVEALYEAARTGLLRAPSGLHESLHALLDAVRRAEPGGRVGGV